MRAGCRSPAVDTDDTADTGREREVDLYDLLSLIDSPSIRLVADLIRKAVRLALESLSDSSERQCIFEIESFATEICHNLLNILV